MNIEKLGITLHPDGCHQFKSEAIYKSVKDAAPEMLEALIDEWKFIESYLASNASRIDGFWYNEFLNRQNAIVKLIEKATGKPWEEVKALIS